MVSLCGYYLSYAVVAVGLDDLGVVSFVAWALMVAAVVLTVVSGAAVLLERPPRSSSGEGE